VTLPPGRNRIANSSEDNGDSPGRLLSGQNGGCDWGQDDINLERNQFGREGRVPLDFPLGKSVFNHDVATLDVTEVTQALEESLSHVAARGRIGPQPAYSSGLGRLLRLTGERRGEEAADHGPDERPALHYSIT